MAENLTQPGVISGTGIHLMAKPIGPKCNLRCKYCFYLEKEALFPEGEKYRMSNDILEAYIRGCVKANMDNPADLIFAWQGGEPTLMGLDFYRKAVELERKYAGKKPFQNTLQTNGTLLDDKWCEFLAKNTFLVGLSLDGPPDIHDKYRVDANGNPTFTAVLRALKLLQKHGVEYNILTCVAKETAKYPLEVYNFFKEQGVKFIQFIPIVERMPGQAACQLGLKRDMPPSLTKIESGEVSLWTVEPEAYGDFMTAVFDQWVRKDVGDMFIMNFEWLVFASIGGDGSVCYMSKKCGNACIVEHNGDIYCCDHYVYPEFRLGNVITDDVKAVVNSDRQRSWGALKEEKLPRSCQECDVLYVCRGGCPKHRFMESFYGEPGWNYLCMGYQKFYRHIRKYMNGFRQLVEHDLPCEGIMQAIERPTIFTSNVTGQQFTLWVK